MEAAKPRKSMWLLHCLLLFAPFLIEGPIALITLTAEPALVWGTVHWIYCYIAYGAACIIHFRWRRKIGCPITLKPRKKDWPWLLSAVAIGVAVSRLSSLVLGFHTRPPMIYLEFLYYMEFEPLILGIGGYILQYVYYVFEFALIAFIVDCAQKTSSEFGWPQVIPWGGVFLALSWGLIHPYGLIQPLLRGEYLYSVYKTLQCLSVGAAYLLPGRKPVYAWLAIMGAYWL